MDEAIKVIFRGPLTQIARPTGALTDALALLLRCTQMAKEVARRPQTCSAYGGAPGRDGHHASHIMLALLQPAS
jgi:hypothetical protein